MIDTAVPREPEIDAPIEEPTPKEIGEKHVSIDQLLTQARSEQIASTPAVTASSVKVKASPVAPVVPPSQATDIAQASGQLDTGTISYADFETRLIAARRQNNKL